MFYGNVRRRTIRKIKPPKAGNSRVKVGVLDAETDKAIWNHFGTAGGASGGGWGGPIPARPWMAQSMRENRSQYRAEMRKGAKSILRGSVSADIIVSRLGILAQGDMQEMLTAMSTPPNAPVTVARKGSSNPLIDTGALRQAHSWELF